MTIKRQQTISKALDALERALDAREALLAKLVRCELTIRKLRKRSSRAQKAYVKGDASVVAGVAPSPFCAAGEASTAELNDPIDL